MDKTYLVLDNLQNDVLCVDSEISVVIEWCENYLKEHPGCLGLTLWENKRLFINQRIMKKLDESHWTCEKCSTKTWNGLDICGLCSTPRKT